MLGNLHIAKKRIGKLLEIDIFLYFFISFWCSLAFVLIYGGHVLIPTYTDWLLTGGDLSQHYLGWAAYRASKWHFPLGMVDTLAFPRETSIIFTDSIPLFALPFKVLSPILPHSFQYFGLWGIVSFVLQGTLTARIIKSFTNNKIIIVLVSVLFIFTPIMITRMYIHSALAGQWIIIFGLEPLLVPDKYNNSKRIYLLCALLAFFSSTVHLYYVLISGIIVMGICIEDILLNKRIKRAFYMLGLYLFIVVTTVYLLGGVSSGVSAVGDGLGLYSFNINALFNPWGWSCILKDRPLINYQYEGFAYLGMGNIFILFLAIIFLIDKDMITIIKRKWGMMVSLVVVAAIACAIAVSPIITINDNVIIEMSPPKVIYKIWSIFRSSGRIVWITVYSIMICSIIVIIKRLGKSSIMITALFLALILQIFDIHNTLNEKKECFDKVVSFDSALHSTGFWDDIAANKEINHIVYYSTVDQNFMYSLTDWALKNSKTVNNFYFARPVPDVEENRNKSLEQLSANTLFIFQLSDRMECSHYPLNYYEVDGVIVGYVKPLEKYEACILR